MTYNGWKNWETWNTYCWLTNDEGMYYAARQVVEDEGDLEEFVVQLYGVDDMPAGLVSDFVSMALHEVDWDEIAEGLREE